MWACRATPRIQRPTNARTRSSTALPTWTAEYAFKDATRYGNTRPVPAAGRSNQPQRRHAFFGFTLVSCERGDIRQIADWHCYYTARGREDVALSAGPDWSQRYTTAELDLMYQAWSTDTPRGVAPCALGEGNAGAVSGNRRIGARAAGSIPEPSGAIRAGTEGQALGRPRFLRDAAQLAPGWASHVCPGAQPERIQSLLRGRADLVSIGKIAGDLE